MAVTLPLSSAFTGTVRPTSGAITPVAFIAEGAGCCSTVPGGYCAGFATVAETAKAASKQIRIILAESLAHLVPGEWLLRL